MPETRKDGKPLPSLMPAMYSHRLSEIQQCALQCGYAIAVHGSMQRDLDLIAVPWYDDAASPAVLVASMCAALGVSLQTGDDRTKPHGRRAYTLLMGGACFMDLSVMPPLPEGISVEGQK